MKVCLDAGHGGIDPGAVGPNNRLEKDDNLNLTLAVGDLVTKSGITVIYTRTTDKYVSLQERANIANSNNCDLFISIQRNAFSDPRANGVEVLIQDGAPPATREKALIIYNKIINVAAQSQRGIREGNYYVTRETKMPAMIVELGFITNPVDNRLFDYYFNEYAVAIAEGICEIFGVPFLGDSGMIERPLYRVQVGAYAIRANAEAELAKLKALGFDGFIVEST